MISFDQILLFSLTSLLLIFFPGSYENNNYRLLDGYDGWNNLAEIGRAHV